MNSINTFEEYSQKIIYLQLLKKLKLEIGFSLLCNIYHIIQIYKKYNMKDLSLILTENIMKIFI